MSKRLDRFLLVVIFLFHFEGLARAATNASFLFTEGISPAHAIAPPVDDHVSRLLAMGWRPREGFSISNRGTNKTLTYGEMTPAGVRQLLHVMNIDDKHDDRPVSFVDLGSGVGKLAIQVYMEVANLERVIGIEWSDERHASAVKAWERLKPAAKEWRRSKAKWKAARLQLIQGDLLHLDLKGLTHVYVSSLCFPESLMERLAEKLLREGSSLQVIATLSRFPTRYDFGVAPQTEYVEMSWSAQLGSPVYFYWLKRTV